MLLKKIRHLSNTIKEFKLSLDSIKKEKDQIDDLKETVGELVEEVSQIKNTMAQKDILLINVFKEVEKTKKEKESLEKDMIAVVSALGSLNIIVENFFLEEYCEDLYKKNFNYH